MVTKTKCNPARLGVGLYSIPEAAKILSAPSNKLYRWLDPEQSVIPRHFDPEEKTITFLELMELHFVEMFRKEGVSLQTIRKAAVVAAKKFKTDYPFCVKRFDTDGRTIFATMLNETKGDGTIVEDLKHGQYVFDQIMRPFFHLLEYASTHEIARYWPLKKTGGIVLDPARHFGKPIDAKTGVPTRTIYEATIAGGGQDAACVARWFEIPLAAVESAVAFEKSLLA